MRSLKTFFVTISYPTSENKKYYWINCTLLFTDDRHQSYLNQLCSERWIRIETQKHFKFTKKEKLQTFGEEGLVKGLGRWRKENSFL